MRIGLRSNLDCGQREGNSRPPQADRLRSMTTPRFRTHERMSGTALPLRAMLYQDMIQVRFVPASPNLASPSFAL